MTFPIVWSSAADKAMKKLAPDTRDRITAAVHELAEMPNPLAGGAKLKDWKPIAWKCRVGSFRVLYRIEAGALLVEEVADRKDIYR